MGKQTDSIAVTILGWEKFNPRGDVKHPSWFRFQHNFFEHPAFYDFTLEERVVWIYLICEASKRNDGGTLTVNTLHAHRVAGLSVTAINSAIRKLKKERMVEIRTVRGRYADVSHPGLTRRDVTDETDETGRDETPTEGRITQPEQLLEIWNQGADEVGLPKAQALTEARRGAAKERIREKPERSYWVSVVAAIRASPFCQGRNDRGWKANFDFLLRPDTHVKALEGRYNAITPGEPALDPKILEMRRQLAAETGRRDAV